MSEAVATAPSVNLARPGAAYRTYALNLLLLIYVLNFLDRQVINILAEAIKKDLHLADWQVGMMSGIAFALFYTILGLPIARIAEHRNRAQIITAALTAWCGFTALCGAAQSFVQLCLLRFGVGVGEAGCTPPALSLITDYYPKERRASALAYYAMGVPLGTLLGMAFGGLVADAYGWRVAFFMAGAPGLVLAVLCLFTLKETRSNLSADAAATRAAQPSVGQALKVLAGKRTFWLLGLAVGFKVLFTDGQGPFTASFFLRNHPAEIAALAAGFGLKSTGFLGVVIGLMNGLLGALSAFLGGIIADRAAARDIRNVVIAPAIALIVTVPAYVAATLVHNTALALVLMGAMGLTNCFWAGPVYATTHSIVPANMRATATAMLLFVINSMGIGLGPVFIGALSDLMAGPFGLGPNGGLRAALIIASVASLLGVVCYVLARRTIVADLEPDPA